MASTQNRGGGVQPKTGTKFLGLHFWAQSSLGLLLGPVTVGGLNCVDRDHPNAPGHRLSVSHESESRLLQNWSRASRCCLRIEDDREENERLFLGHSPLRSQGWRSINEVQPVDQYIDQRVNPLNPHPQAGLPNSTHVNPLKADNALNP